MEADWNGHKLRVTGDWTHRYLYLAPTYELWLDDIRLDRSGGPRVQPRLEAVYEDEEGALHHIEANLLSIVGFRPRCELTVEGEPLLTERVSVQNVLNPILILVILIASAVMLKIGPVVLRGYFSG